MAETLTRTSWELTEALAMLREREVYLVSATDAQAQPRPWCRPRDAAAIRRCVVDRSSDLWPYLRAAVRLVRAAALAAQPRGYADFLYGSVRALTAAHFRAAFLAARDRGRLPRSALEVGPEVGPEEAIVLLEPEMQVSASAQGFELTFAQMSRPAALIDVIHNTLGYKQAADLLAPLTTAGKPAATADEVARRLRRAFNAWLAVRLDSARHRQQAKLMHSFLRAAGCDAPGPESVTDDSILAFWQQRAAFWYDSRPSFDAAAGERKAAAVDRAAQDEGFCGFRATAKGMLRYRRCLYDARGCGLRSSRRPAPTARDRRS